MNLELKLDGDGCWPDLKDYKRGELTGVALLPDGEVRKPDGTVVRMPILTLKVANDDGTTTLVQLKVDAMSTVMASIRGRLDYLEAVRASAKGEG